MHNSYSLLTAFLTLALVAGPAWAAEKSRGQKQLPPTRVTVIDNGPGESKDQRMYRIICPDGHETSIAHDFVNGKVCFTSYQCEAGNNVDAAAVRACASKQNKQIKR